MIEHGIIHLVLGAVATNCWLVPLEPSGLTDKRPCAVIDPADQADVIIARMERLRLFPRMILLTHGHFDHLAALPDISAAFPPSNGVEIAIHQDDASSLGPDAYSVHRASFTAAGSAAYVDGLWKPMPAPTRLLAGGDRIGPFTVLHLPGHTPGSVGLLLEKEGVLFSGDTLFQGGVGRTDLPGGDWGQLRESLERLAGLDPALAVYPGHGPVSSIGQEFADARR
jgi:glyoxylase-like metal-dependent hydrolase (beta-lactamase superfamily II)